jgi:uncharacterized membrane protein YdbT with pleckstrin-like domain
MSLVAVLIIAGIACLLLVFQAHFIIGIVLLVIAGILALTRQPWTSANRSNRRYW